MTIGGLRGAVAFYLALNLHTDYKDALITLTSVLIMMTVVGLGSITNCVLKVLNWICPQDKIFEEKEDLLLDQQVERSESEQSAGVFTRLEYFDENFGQKYFRKNGGVIKRENGSEIEFDDDENDDITSVISRREDMMEDFFNRDVRGGDLSPYRKLSLRFKRKTSEQQPSLKKQDRSVPISASKTLRDPHLTGLKGDKNKKKSFEIPIQDLSTTPKNNPDQKQLPIIIPLNMIQEEDSVEDRRENRNRSEPLKASTKSEINKRDRYKKKLSTLQ